jgi:GNAT superfamily N-acetyltransferase
MTIKRADRKKDYNDIWKIFSTVIKTGDTYVFDPATSKSDLQKLWLSDVMDTFVALDDSGVMIGTYFIKPNQIDLGNHIANCGYMVDPQYQGRGVGAFMCEHSITFAKEKGYEGIQFNIVVSTNTKAIRLWQKFGFEIIGTTPKAFRHAELGFIDSYIMFKSL